MPRHARSNRWWSERRNGTERRRPDLERKCLSVERWCHQRLRRPVYPQSHWFGSVAVQKFDHMPHEGPLSISKEDWISHSLLLQTSIAPWQDLVRVVHRPNQPLSESTIQQAITEIHRLSIEVNWDSHRSFSSRRATVLFEYRWWENLRFHSWIQHPVEYVQRSHPCNEHFSFVQDGWNLNRWRKVRKSINYMFHLPLSACQWSGGSFVLVIGCSVKDWDVTLFLAVAADRFDGLGCRFNCSQAQLYS